MTVENDAQAVVESPETTETDEDTVDVSTLSHEDALKALKKARNEAASRRIKNKEAEEKAAKWEEHVKSQMTELERVSAENADLKSKLATKEVETLRNKIVAEAGIDPELAVFLTGTEKEMKAQAAKLAEKAGKANGTAPDFYAGQRGNKVTPKAETLNDVFAQMWKEVDSHSGRRKFTPSS